MTSKIRHSQLDTKGINHIKSLYQKYIDQAQEIYRALNTMRKFGLPVISNVTVDAMNEKAYFYRQQARTIDEYLCKRLERTVSGKRIILVEKNNFSDGPVTDYKGYEIGFAFMGGSMVTHKQKGTDTPIKIQISKALPANKYISKHYKWGIGIFKDVQAGQDRHPPQRDESCEEAPVVQAHPFHTRSESIQGDSDGSSPSAPQSYTGMGIIY